MTNRTTTQLHATHYAKERGGNKMAKIEKIYWGILTDNAATPIGNDIKIPNNRFGRQYLVTNWTQIVSPGESRQPSLYNRRKDAWADCGDGETPIKLKVAIEEAENGKPS